MRENPAYRPHVVLVGGGHSHVQVLRRMMMRPWPEARVQPVVRWRGDLIVKATGIPVHVDGHVEVRWSHGRFQGSPEAKVYLKTPHLETPGYTELA